MSSFPHGICDTHTLNSKLSVVENIFVKESSVGSDMTVTLNLDTSRSLRLGVTPRSQVDKAIREVASKTYWLPPKISYL